jgi:hypothetical protein
MLTLVIAVVSGLCLALGWAFELVVLVYIALAVSLAGLVLLGVQIWRQRHPSTVDETADSVVPAADLSAEDVPSDDAEKTDIGKTEPAEEPQPATAPNGPAVTNGSGELVDLVSGGPLDKASSVYVISGRKRFHVSGCRLIVDQCAEELTLLEAREETFTPCSMCLTTEAGQLLTNK